MEAIRKREVSLLVDDREVDEKDVGSNEIGIGKSRVMDRMDYDPLPLF